MNIAVCIPAHNEDVEIEAVVKGFKAAIPDSSVYVYDNNSTDNTAYLASKAGAIVRNEYRQGKGFVVRRMLSEVDADVYIIVDGDNTYDPTIAPVLVNTLIKGNLDMVIGSRLHNDGQFRRGHYLGNRFFSKFVTYLFSAHVEDLLSGYRVLSRRFVKSFPISSEGFEIESEMTIHCLGLGLPFEELATNFKDRSNQSESKLKTFSDGFRILGKIVVLLKEVRPLVFFGFWAMALFLFGAFLFIPVLTEYIATGLVPRFPTLIVSVGIFVLSLISVVCGVILDSIARGRRELKRLFYLQHGKGALS